MPGFRPCLFLTHKRNADDWLSGPDDAKQAATTAVFMTIDPSSTHTVNEVFEYYSVPREDFAFNKTTVSLRLLDTGDQSLVSRSQAKRVLARLPRFKEVILDSTGITSIGPAFADEIFRVFATAHPDVNLIPLRASPEVHRMIERARGEAAQRLADSDGPELNRP